MRHGVTVLVIPLLALIASIGAGRAQAADSPYTGEVPVASQSDADRADGLKAAMGQVVSRVAGDASVLKRPDVAAAIDQAESYVQQFQYRQEVVNDSNGQPHVQLTLVAEFDHDAVDRLAHGTTAAANASADATATPAEPTLSSYHVWVGGLHSAMDYARLMGALAADDYVRDTEVELARGDGVQLRLSASVPLARVLGDLDAGTVVRVTNAKPPVDGIDALLDLKP